MGLLGGSLCVNVTFLQTWMHKKSKDLKITSSLLYYCNHTWNVLQKSEFERNNTMLKQRRNNMNELQSAGHAWG